MSSRKLQLYNIKTVIPDIIIEINEKISNNTIDIKSLLHTLQIKNIKGGNKKTKKYIKKGGQVTKIQIQNTIIFIVIIAVLFVPSEDANLYFNALYTNTKDFFDYCYAPFCKTIGANIIANAFNKFTGIFNSDILAINGLWALYINTNKLIDYLTKPYAIEKVETIKQVIKEGLENIATETIRPSIVIASPHLNKVNIIEDDEDSIIEDDYNRMIIPPNSILLTKK